MNFAGYFNSKSDKKYNFLVEATTSFQVSVDGKIVIGGFSDTK